MNAGAPTMLRRPDASGRGQWIAATLLILLSAIPIAVGIYLVISLANGEVRPETARHVAAPAPVVLHVISAAIFAIFGALQFVAVFRRRFPTWHRRAGRALMATGLVAGLSALAITLFYERLPDTNDLLFAIRLVVSTAMIAFIVFGFREIRRGDIPRHRAWMMRAYAIALGVGTQALVFMVAEMVTGGPADQFGKSILMGASWLINLAAAEWLIRRNGARQPASAALVQIKG